MLTATAVKAHTHTTGGGPDRPIHPDQMSQTSGISWQTGFTSVSNRRAYLPACNFNKRLSKNMRYFGKFFCHCCKRHWQSANAFQRSYQKCSQCNRRTYPNKLQPLMRAFPGGEKDEKPPHDMDRCQRCKKLGRSCENEPPGPDTGIDSLSIVSEGHDQHRVHF